jgi:4'-phosphopantetheinyl transferase
MNFTRFEQRTPFEDFNWNLEKTHVIRIDVKESYKVIEGSYEKILTEKELNKAARFFHISDSQSYIVRKYYLRLILSKILSIPPALLGFKYSANKKLTISGVEFNTSHSGNYALIAVSKNSIGIDIEKIDESFEFNWIANTCFSVEERKFMNSGNGLLNFYYLWTRKEAILKASGEGLTDSVILLNCLPNKVTRNALTYHLKTFVTDQQYIITIAAMSSTDELLYSDICG